MLNLLVQWLESWQSYLQQLGWLGMLAFAGAFVIFQMFIVPVSPMGFAAGMFFGFTYGWVSLMLGCAVGASINFLIARHVAREAVAKRLHRNEKFRLIDQTIGREGWKIVVLLRFVPIPFGLANYCYGLTPVGYLPYLGATMLAVIPTNAFFVWIGSTCQGSLSSLVGKGRAHHPLEYVFLGVGVIAAFVVLRFLSKAAQASVNKSQSTSGPANPEP